MQVSGQPAQRLKLRPSDRHETCRRAHAAVWRPCAAAGLPGRCLAALAEWEQLGRLCRGEWRRVEPHVRRDMAALAAHAAWHLGEWCAGAAPCCGSVATPQPQATSRDAKRCRGLHVVVWLWLRLIAVI